MIFDFLYEYDRFGMLKFTDVKYRPGASFSTGFGLDNTFNKLRIHSAIDRGFSNSSIYKVYAPFDIDNAQYIPNYGTYGALLFLPLLNYDFEIRIAHMRLEEFQFPFKEVFSKDKTISILRNTYIGDAGNLGTSSGPEIVKGKAGAHTHTEIVSKESTSIILEYILQKRFKIEDINKEYDETDIKLFSELHKLNYDECMVQYGEEYSKRKIEFLNSYKCIRKDYHTGERKTFYNSMLLFGF